MLVLNKKQKKICLLSILYVYHKNKSRKHCRIIYKKRRFWVRDIFKNRKSQGAFHNLMVEMKLTDAQKYFNYLQMSQEKFENLVQLVGPAIQKLYIKREPIEPAERLAATLRYLASGDSMVSISYAFRLGTTTISNIINETCKAIWDVLSKKVFKEANEENWLKYSDEFEMLWHLPHCIGAIDGKHIVLQAPPYSGSQFYNYKGSHSLVLLALCDARYQFIAVDIGAQGRQSDGGVFRYSEIGKQLLNGQFNLPPPTPLEAGGEDIPYFIVGDSAFPLATNLMRPYAGNSLPLHKRLFNYRLSRGRRVSENSFGILVSRWRILRKSIIASLDTVEGITKAVVVLHNWIMSHQYSSTMYCPPGYVDKEDENGNIIPGQWRRDNLNIDRIQRMGSNMYKKNADRIRENLALYFCSEGAVSFQWDK